MAPVPQVAGLDPRRRCRERGGRRGEASPPGPRLPSSLERQSGTCQRGQFTSIWKIKEIK